jgi:hypothetical protein
MKRRFVWTLLWVTLGAFRLLGPAEALGQQVAGVTGTVFDQTGAVIQDATLRLFSLDQFRDAKSDNQGKFAFGELPSGGYELHAYSLGFEMTILHFAIPSTDTQPLSIILTVSGVPSNCGQGNSGSYEPRHSEKIGLAGTVVDLDEGPLARAKVIVSESVHNQPVATRHADNRGNFQFHDLPPGKYTITASARGYRALPSGTFWITRETLTKIDITATRNGRLFVCQ